MNFTEEAFVFSAGGEELLGVIAKPEIPQDCGVLIVVGGPQYRVGSHRQFLLLSRRLASEGYPSMRFDYRGMGDSGGAMRDFDNVADDIEAATAVFQQTCSSARRVVLWGLCDAASAALLYVQATGDSRIAGLVLLNPWVRSEASLAQTHIKHYYGQRLLQREFWVKLLSGKMRLLESARGLLSNALKARESGVGAKSEFRSFQDRMADGLRHFPGKVLLILSGQDYTAKEFLEYAGANGAWAGLLSTDGMSRVDIPDADHTFSSQTQRSSVENATLDWLGKLNSSRPLNSRE
ncbi:MAG: hydrolase 1, exosortase A system-associated [Propionivibrio sp.]|nr:hydrolase 1, exosortase A system-associated [Propionivibrio sp.]